MSAALPITRPLTVDLHDLPQEAMSALRREAERQAISLPALLGQFVVTESEGLLTSQEPKEPQKTSRKQ